MTKPLHKGRPGLLLPCLLAIGIVAATTKTTSAQVVAQPATLIVQPGTRLQITGGYTVLSDVNLTNNGQWQSIGGITSFTGSGNTTAGGSGITKLYQANLNKSQTSTLTLNTTLQITNAVNFTKGLLDLNGRQLQLTDTAKLNGETDQSRIIGPHGGKTVVTAAVVNNPAQLDLGNLGAMLTSPANLGSLTVNRSQQPITTGGTGIQRTYFIQPQNNTNINATLRFYYLDAELNGNDAATLNLWKSEDGIAWTLAGADTRDVTNHYVEKSGIADLSYWTLADLSNPLPVKLTSFNALCAGSYALIDWSTAAESQINEFLVQRSLDGTTWTTLGAVAAQNAPTGATYKFNDPTPQPDCEYRLAIVAQDGSYTYSPVFRGGCSDIGLPFRVYPNPAESQTIARISLRQAAVGRLQIVTMSGQTIYEAEWNLQPGINQYIIPVTGWAAGSYLLRLVLPNGIQTTQLIKK